MTSAAVRECATPKSSWAHEPQGYRRDWRSRAKKDRLDATPGLTMPPCPSGNPGHWSQRCNLLDIRQLAMPEPADPGYSERSLDCAGAVVCHRVDVTTMNLDRPERRTCSFDGEAPFTATIFRAVIQQAVVVRVRNQEAFTENSQAAGFIHFCCFTIDAATRFSRA